MVCLQSRFWLSTLAVSLACSAMSAGLGDLKRDTDKKIEQQQPKPEKSSKEYSSAATSSFGSGTYPSEPISGSGGSGFMSDFWGWVVASPFRYRSEDPSSSMNPTEEEGWAKEGGLYAPRHKQGQAVMPYARIDLNWQHIDSDNTAIDGRIELGYKAIGFQARSTKYDDRLSGYTQRINQYYGLLRYGGRWPDAFPGSFEIAFGIGVAQHNGDLSNDSSVALTFPLKYYPAEWLGFEFRPAWYEADYGPGIVYGIGDYDFSASLGHRYLHARAGYRWLWYNGSDNGYYTNGPYLGISASF